jgi:prepilin-type N-terminal cleavage/methylation domain-containing protein
MAGKAGPQQRGFTLIEIIITLTVSAVLATMIYMYFGKAFEGSATSVMRLRNAVALQRVMENIRADYYGYPKWRSGAAYTVGNVVIPTNFDGLYRYLCTSITGTGTSGLAEPTWDPNMVNITDNEVTWKKMPLMWVKNTTYAVGTIVDPPTIPSDSKWHRYRCTTAGTSGGTPPVWPTNSGGTVNDNGVVWTETSRWMKTFLTTLSGRIGAKDSIRANSPYGLNPDGTTYTKYTVVSNGFIRFDSTNTEVEDPSGTILKVTIKNDDGVTLTALFVARDF